mmetsp:Transcript_19577/g.29108  ORF Transcript_19577/g.29108 Transcript_19577/m.29108 type:complete len:207 (+) Transcript_19577:681-1301(+)
MKPSFTPCFSRKASLCLPLSSIKYPISTSWKVVSMAAVFCASFNLVATRWRMRDILTRFSVRSSVPLGFGGAVGAGFAAGGGGGGTGFSTTGGAVTASGSAAGVGAEAGGAVSSSRTEPPPSLGLPSVSILNRSCPTSTTSSISPRISVMTPSSGARTSTLTLSVSSTITTSSALTNSGVFIGISTIVPSVILSPIVGTSIVLIGI